LGANFRRLIVCNAMLAKLSVAFNQKLLGNSDLVSNTAKRSREEVGITVTLPKPMTSNSKAEGHFGKQDFRYVAEEDVYICPAGEKLATNKENGMLL
jgi:hypothetical protein